MKVCIVDSYKQHHVVRGFLTRSLSWRAVSYGSDSGFKLENEVTVVNNHFCDRSFKTVTTGTVNILVLAKVAQTQ